MSIKTSRNLVPSLRGSAFRLRHLRQPDLVCTPHYHHAIIGPRPIMCRAGYAVVVITQRSTYAP